MKEKVTAIVLAAGKGSRMHSEIQKQYMTLLDRPVITYALEAFEKSSVDEIIGKKLEQLSTIQQHKKSLIYEYVTGKKRVKEVQ